MEPWIFSLNGRIIYPGIARPLDVTVDGAWTVIDGGNDPLSNVIPWVSSDSEVRVNFMQQVT
jgi:hypothetical protein